MQLLYCLSNIVIPLSLLGLLTLRTFNSTKTTPHGKWFLMIILIIFFNILNSLFQTNFLILFTDMALKVIVTFLPAGIDAKVQGYIKMLHLADPVKRVRCRIIKSILRFQTGLIQFTLEKLPTDQQLQCRLTLIDSLQHKRTDPSNARMDKSSRVKTSAIYQNQRKQIDQFLQKHKDKSATPIYESKAQRIITQQSQVSFQKQEIQSFMHKQEIQSSFRKQEVNLSNGIDINRSQEFTPSEILAPEEDYVMNQSQEFTQSEIMAPENDFDNQPRLLCKVESIVEIGVDIVQLQLYNVQLYSNNEVRILSLFDRQFERHTLQAVQKLNWNYYNLVFKGGEIDKRKVKFRGDARPFLEFLIN